MNDDQMIDLCKAIAPPVAAGSVDTVEGDDFLLALALCTQSRREVKEEDKYYRRLVVHINAWGAQQREAGYRDGLELGSAGLHGAIETAKKAEAELKLAKAELSLANAVVEELRSDIAELK